MKANKIISIGYLGWQKCYLNISVEEAIERYKLSENEDDEYMKTMTIKVIEFDTEFSVYDIWENENG